jgi:hypothetical protein
MKNNKKLKLAPAEIPTSVEVLIEKSVDADTKKDDARK